jgi:cytochrome c oxidase subunit II
MVRIFKTFMLALSLFLMTSAAAQAQVTVQGVPVERGLGFQDPATPIMERAVAQYNVLILPIMAAVTIFVLVLLLWTCWKFREQEGRQPSTVTHNTMIEVVWTAVPILILVVLFIPAMRFLYFNENGPDMLINGERGYDKHAELVIQATGNQWNWSYEYLLYRDENGVETDVSGIEFTANMLSRDALLADTRRDQGLYKGEADYHVVIPTNTVVRFNVTATDVLHAFAMPAWGVKIDAIPGHMNATWALVNADKAGLYIGQCSEICGDRHSFMPIAVDALPKDEFLTWAATAKKELEGGAIGPSLPAVYDNQVAAAN